MLAFRDWEIRTLGIETHKNAESPIPHLTFRQIEKNMLHLTKNILQATIVTLARYWFIVATKTDKKIQEKWPRVYALFTKKELPPNTEVKLTFFRKAMLESKAKIRRVREAVRKEHAESEIKDNSEI